MVKAFGLERRAIGAYRGAMEGCCQVIVRVVVTQRAVRGEHRLAVTFGSSSIIGVGGYLVIKGH